MVQGLVRAALYARVSTDQQEKEATIQSQVEALRKYAHDKGYQITGEYLDDGYSGAKLARPGLDKLRDGLGSGGVDLVLFHSPDRLARKALYQGIVLEEIEKAGVKFEFLNHPVDDSPEGKMLLGMQGLFAEYEVMKILERTRRGKLHKAREGGLMGGRAPYGYRWVKRTESQRASLEIEEYQGAVIRKMYRWLTEEKLSTWAIAKRLSDNGVPTARSAARWQPMAVYKMLTNPAYKGEYQYHHSADEVVIIPVPPIVDQTTWKAAQAQMQENSRFSSRNNKLHQYLLRGLICCPRCGGAYTGYVQRGTRGYKCNRAHWASSSTGQKCPPGAIPAQPVEDAVWDAVADALRRPELLIEEYQRRLVESGSVTDLEFERKQVSIALKRVKGREDRITDAYVNEAMELERYKAEMDRLRAEREELQRMVQDIDRRQRQDKDSHSALEHLERFCNQVAKGLEALTFEERQQLLRLVVERITVEDGRVKVETVIPTRQDDVKLCKQRGELVEPCRGFVPSPIEGPVLSEVEGPVLSEVEGMVETPVKRPLKPGFDFEYARRDNLTLEAPAIYRSVNATVPAESMEVVYA